MSELRIAFVDAEPTIHEMMRTILFGRETTAPLDLFSEQSTEESVTPEGDQFNIDFFSEPDTAQTALKEAFDHDHPYSLLITDIRMPGYDDTWLIRKAREIDSNIRIIVFTSYEDITVKELAKSAKNEEFLYLEKTGSPVVIKQAVDSELATWLTLNRNQRLLERLAFKREVRFKLPGIFSGLTVDVSSEGIGMIDIPKKIEVDSPVEFELDAGAVSLKGQVRWLTKEKDGYRAGIQFDKEDRKLLELMKRTGEG